MSGSDRSTKPSSVASASHTDIRTLPRLPVAMVGVAVVRIAIVSMAIVTMALRFGWIRARVEIKMSVMARSRAGPRPRVRPRVRGGTWRAVLGATHVHVLDALQGSHLTIRLLVRVRA